MDEDPGDDYSGSPRLRRRRLLTRLFAGIVILVFFLAFPLGNALLQLHQTGDEQAAFAVAEVAVFAIVYLLLRSRRRGRRG